MIFKHPCIKSDIVNDYAYMLSIKNNDKNIPTIVWIPGGGLSSLVFAFSGVGPFLINKCNCICNNKNQLYHNQLFLDTSGTGFSVGQYPKNDKQLVNSFNQALLEICQKFHISKIILVGVSYGGKTAVQIQKTLNNSIHIEKIIAITPFFDPIHSQSYIPYPGDKFNYYVLNERKINTLRERFKKYLSDNNFDESVKYVDETGLFSDYTKCELGLSKKQNINMWNIKKYYESTLGNWSIPKILKQIYLFFWNNSSNSVIKIIPGLSNLYKLGKKQLLNSGDYFLNINFWHSLVYSHIGNNLSSYLTGVSIDKLNVPLIVISGGFDVITSYQGLKVLVKNKPNVCLYRIPTGTHLLCLNHGKLIKNIIECK